MEPALHGVAQGLGLLEYLLEHEVGETSLLDLAEGELELADDGGLLDAAEVGDAQLLTALYVCDLLLPEVYDPVGVFDDGGGVGGHEVFVLSHTDEQGTALAGGNDPVRLLLVDYGQGVGAHDVSQCEGHGIPERDAVGVHHVLDELDYNLGVGLAGEVVAEARELGAQRKIVLDDAVVDDGEPAVLRDVGVGVDVAGLSVGRPAGVGYAYAAADILACSQVLEVLHLAPGLVDHELRTVVDQRHSRAVISSVFQTLEPLYQYRVGLAASHISYYSTHH